MPPQRHFLPVCTTYASVVLDRVAIQVSGNDHPLMQSVECALGVLPDGELEVLGAWLASSDTRRGNDLFADLRVRGLEMVRFIVCPHPLMTSPRLQAHFPQAKASPSLGALVQETLSHVAARNRLEVAQALKRIWEAESLASAQDALDALAAGPLAAARFDGLVDRWRVALAQLAPFYALPGRLRRHIRSGERIVQRLRQTMSRAIERHGAFEDGEAALSFVHVVLRRSERRLDGLAGRPAVASRRLYPPSRAGVAAAEF